MQEPAKQLRSARHDKPLHGEMMFSFDPYAAFEGCEKTAIGRKAAVVEEDIGLPYRYAKRILAALVPTFAGRPPHDQFGQKNEALLACRFAADSSGNQVDDLPAQFLNRLGDRR